MKKCDHIFSLFLTLIFALQIGFPGQVQASTAGEYICNPGGKPPTAEAIAQIQELFAAAGKTLPEDVKSADHCPDCLAPALIALPVLAVRSGPTTYYRDRPQTPRVIDVYYAPQGPPLGGRAPPTFI